MTHVHFSACGNLNGCCLQCHPTYQLAARQWRLRLTYYDRTIVEMEQNVFYTVTPNSCHRTLNHYLNLVEFKEKNKNIVSCIKKRAKFDALSMRPSLFFFFFVDSHRFLCRLDNYPDVTYQILPFVMYDLL